MPWGLVVVFIVGVCMYAALTRRVHRDAARSRALTALDFTAIRRVRESA